MEVQHTSTCAPSGVEHEKDVEARSDGVNREGDEMKGCTSFQGGGIYQG